ncbi:MAG: putative Ig domain-containing protein [Planctomycetota bacterium]
MYATVRRLLRATPARDSFAPAAQVARGPFRPGRSGWAPRPLACSVTCLVLGLTACGGGGGSSTPAAPALRYAQSRIEAAVGVPLTPLSPVFSNAPAGVTFAIDPALPAGLALDPSTGVLSGTAQAVTSTGLYTVTAGGVSAELTLRVSFPSRFLVSGSAVDGTLLVQGLDAETGAVRTIDLDEPESGLPPVSDLAQGPGFLLVAHGAAGQAGTLVAYTLNSGTGALVERGRAALGLGPHRIALLDGTSAAYVCSTGSDSVRAFTIGNGAPTAIGAALPTGDGPLALCVLETSAGSDVLVAANRAGQSLSSYLIDPVTRGLTSATQAFVLNGGVPSGLASAYNGERVLVTLENFALAITVGVDTNGTLSAVFGGAQTGLDPSAIAVHPRATLRSSRTPPRTRSASWSSTRRRRASCRSPSSTSSPFAPAPHASSSTPRAASRLSRRRPRAS